MVLLLGLAGWLVYCLLAGCLNLCIYLAMGIWKLDELAVGSGRRERAAALRPSLAAPTGWSGS